MSVTTSKCTAPVTKHVKRQIHTFHEPVTWSTRIVSGPAKSTPVYEKAGSSFTRNIGRGGGGGLLKGLPQIFWRVYSGESSTGPSSSPSISRTFFWSQSIFPSLHCGGPVHEPPLQQACSGGDSGVEVPGASSQKELPHLRVILHNAKSLSHSQRLNCFC